jgi:type IV pilus assembly protein PilB
MRQEPNIILLGEIRDAETGIIAAEAALTGNLILSTMLSGDAVGAVSRLLNLGVSPYWLAATLIGVVYQKLVRKICDTCKQAYHPTIEESSMLSPVIQTVSNLYRGKGCAACSNTGYIGRTAIHEIVLIDDVLHDLIYQQATILKLKEVAVASGFENIRIDAARKVAAGITTIDEFTRALG